MPIIEPINRRQQQCIVHLTERYIQTANTLYNQSFPMIQVDFDLIGYAAGMYCVDRKYHRIRYNPYLFAKYFTDNKEETVPHEVAHYVTDKIYNLHKIRPHGKEWAQVMRAFGATPQRTGSYNLEGIPTRRQRRFQYQCTCTTHQLTTRRHNQISRGKAYYLCRNCGDRLVHVK